MKVKNTYIGTVLGEDIDFLSNTTLSVTLYICSTNCIVAYCRALPIYFPVPVPIFFQAVTLKLKFSWLLHRRCSSREHGQDFVDEAFVFVRAVGAVVAEGESGDAV